MQKMNKQLSAIVDDNEQLQISLAGTGEDLQCLYVAISKAMLKQFPIEMLIQGLAIAMIDDTDFEIENGNSVKISPLLQKLFREFGEKK